MGGDGPKCVCKGTPAAFPGKEGDNGKFESTSRELKDKPHCCFFLVVMGVLVGVIAWSLVEGDKYLYQLKHGIDYSGNVCGISAGFESKPYLYFCGTHDWKADSPFPEKLNYVSKTCVAACPKSETDMVDCLSHQMVDFRDKGEAKTLGGVTYDNTLFLEITQSVTKQKGYPSQEIEGTYCVPKTDGLDAATQGAAITKGDELRTGLEGGPLLDKVRIATAAASFWGGWWIIVVGIVLTMIVCNVYLYVLQMYAGVIILMTMVACIGVMAILGLFFVVGTFMPSSASNSQDFYNLLNPIFCLITGPEANFLSLIVGIVCLACSFCLMFNVQNQKIDESMGIVAAATHAMFSNWWIFFGQPIMGSLIMTVLGIFLLYGYFLATTVRTLNTGLIAIEDETTYQNGAGEAIAIGGLQSDYQMAWWWEILLKVYCLGAVWLILIALAIGNFMASFTVCSYFFTEGDEVSTPEAEKLGRAVKSVMNDPNEQKKISKIQLKNAGGDEGPRTGYRETIQGQKFIVVPVGPVLPSGKEFNQLDEKHVVKKMATSTWISGLRAAIGCHLGSLALGAWVNTLTEPLRTLSMILKSFVGDSASYLDEDTGCKNILFGGCALVAAFLDELFGKFSKTMYSEIVLSSDDLMTASQKVSDFVGQAGGNVALLHGASTLYEWIAVIMITGFVTLVTFIIAEVIFGSNEQVSVGLIVFLTSVLSFLISSLFMSLLDTTCNSLLYSFAWARKVHGVDCYNRNDGKDGQPKIMPSDMKYLMGKELDIAPKDALKPQGKAFRQSKHAHAAAKYQQTLRKAWAETSFQRPGGLMEQLPLLSKNGP